VVLPGWQTASCANGFANETTRDGGDPAYGPKIGDSAVVILSIRRCPASMVVMALKGHPAIALAVSPDLEHIRSLAVRKQIAVFILAGRNAEVVVGPDVDPSPLVSTRAKGAHSSRSLSSNGFTSR
jgi:hypothetical protein